jgi:hypothetical protein
LQLQSLHLELSARFVLARLLSTPASLLLGKATSRDVGFPPELRLVRFAAMCAAMCLSLSTNISKSDVEKEADI